MFAQTSFDPARAADGLYAVGRWLLDQNRHKDAACVFRALATAVPSDERGWLGLGACHEAINQHAIAMQIYLAGEEVAMSARCAIAEALLHRLADDAAMEAEALERAASMTNDDAVLEMIERTRR